MKKIIIISFLMSIGSLFAATEDVSVEGGVKRVRLLCCAGLCKTGNTAVRPKLRALHDKFREQGVLVVRSDFHHAPHRLTDYLTKDPEWLQKKAALAQEQGFHTVVLYSENLLTQMDPLAFAQRANAFFDVQFSFCVRDMYPLLYTLYQEWRKGDMLWETCAQRLPKGYEGIEQMHKVLGGDFPVTLINYDHHKAEIMQEIFRANGVEIDWERLGDVDVPRANRSVALEEWNIMEAFRRARVRISPQWACKYWKATEAAYPGRTSFRFYDAEADAALYKAFGPLIGKINDRLPPEEKIPTSPHMPLGYTTQWDSSQSTAEDVRIVVKAFGTAHLFKHEKSAAFKARKAEFPETFDPYAYVAAGHLDLLPAKTDPFAHYLAHKPK